MTPVRAPCPPSADPREPSCDEADRRAARLRAYELIRAGQFEDGLTLAHIQELIAEAEARGWPDVVKLGMFLGVFHGRFIDRGTGDRWIATLLERAESDGDEVMSALALASRAQDLSLTAGRAPTDADRDLARAIVLLEGHTGPRSEAVSAHIECAYACEARDLWELQIAHTEAAEACLDMTENPPNRAEVLLYNRAEVEVTWLAALRERGPIPELFVRAEEARRALRAADVPTMPPVWKDDLAIFGELVDAIAPPAGGAGPITHPAEGRYPGFIHLARALRTGDAARALVHCELAIESIDPLATQRIHLVALALAVELEARIAGGETAALRWGRQLVAQRWERRIAALASMQSLVDIERRAAEHALLSQHAYLDDLTGLANRRALARFAEGHRARGTQQVAVALLDLDDFKSVNDGFGHAAGDEVLVRIADLLRRGVREEDLVVRLGGDEFLILLLVSGLDTARRRCESILRAVNASPPPAEEELPWTSASIGVAFGPLGELEALTARADAALYCAKQSGGARLLSDAV